MSLSNGLQTGVAPSKYKRSQSQRIIETDISQSDGTSPVLVIVSERLIDSE